MNEDDHGGTVGAPSEAVQSLIPSPAGSVYNVEGNSSRSVTVLTGGNRPILKPNLDGCAPSDLDDVHLFIDLYPVQDLSPIEDSDVTLSLLMKYTEGENFDLFGISNFLSSPNLDPNLQCAALQLLEHAAEWQNANFTKCMSVTFGPVAKLVLDSQDTQVRCAALDTLKLFLAYPGAPDLIRSMVSSGVVDAISDALDSPDLFVQLASVELLDVASRSKEILIQFSAAIPSIACALPSMQTATQVTALKVLEICAGSKTSELAKAVADTFSCLDESLRFGETAVQIAALKVLEAAMGTEDPDLACAISAIMPVVMEIQWPGETYVGDVGGRVLEMFAYRQALQMISETGDTDVDTNDQRAEGLTNDGASSDIKGPQASKFKLGESGSMHDNVTDVHSTLESISSKGNTADWKANTPPVPHTSHTLCPIPVLAKAHSYDGTNSRVVAAKSRIKEPTTPPVPHTSPTFCPIPVLAKTHSYDSTNARVVAVKSRIKKPTTPLIRAPSSPMTKSQSLMYGEGDITD